MQTVRPLPHHDLSRTRVESSFFNQVYTWMAIGLALTGVVAWFTVHNESIFQMVMQWYIPLILLELGVVLGLSFLIGKLSGAQATAAFVGYAALNGLTLSIVLAIYTQASVASAFFTAAGMFAAAGAYGYFTKRDLSGFGRFLFMGLIGLVIASLVNLFFQNSAVDWTISVLGVFIFAGLTAYDHQKLREMSYAIDSMGAGESSNNIRRMVILGALTLYLDFINLFISLLRLMGSRE